MRISILFGGQAGQGPNILTQLTGEALAESGYYVFYARDYESLIRGGHNFNVLTFSDEPVYSNEKEVDIIVALDENTEKIHRKELKKNGFLINGKYENMYFAGRLFKLLCMDFGLLENQLRKLKNLEANLKNAKKGYADEHGSCSVSKPKGRKDILFMNGSQGIAEGAIKSGLDLYYAYPMTPATPVMFELAPKQDKDNFLIIETESEISAVISAIGSAVTGAKAMVGTAGGGFDLMTEAMSFAGQAEVPLVVYVAQRPGPGTGVATYNSQGDLQMVRHCGHGEFFRMVLAPGDPIECQNLVSQAFYFSQKFKTQAVVLSDKHLAESFYTLAEKPKIQKSEKLARFGRYNSYEHTETGEATENAEIIKKNFERREKKTLEIEKEAEKFEMFRVYGNRNSKNVIVSWGSTKGAVLDAISGLDVKFIQMIYINPFPKKFFKEVENAKNILLVENSATGMLAEVIREKTGMEIREKILRYDGRPFLSDELNAEIKKRI